MREALLCDIPIIITLLHTSYSNLEGVEWHLSQKVRNKLENSYLLNEENTILIIFERVGEFKCQVHAYIKPEARGKVALKFFSDTQEYMRFHHKYTCFLSFVPKDSPHIERVLKLAKFKYVGELEDAGGLGSPEKLYISKGE